MLLALIPAFALNATIAHGHGKPIFFALFMTALVTKIAQNGLTNRKVILFLVVVAGFHLALIFLLPLDNRYPGALLVPAGMVDLVILYYLFRRVAGGTDGGSSLDA